MAVGDERVGRDGVGPGDREVLVDADQDEDLAPFIERAGGLIVDAAVREPAVDGFEGGGVLYDGVAAADDAEDKAVVLIDGGELVLQSDRLPIDHGVERGKRYRAVEA